MNLKLSLKISLYPAHVWLVHLDKHQSGSQVVLSSISSGGIFLLEFWTFLISTAPDFATSQEGYSSSLF